MKKYGEMDINKYKEMEDSRMTKGIKVLKREGLVGFTKRFGHYLYRASLRAVSPAVIHLAPKRFFSYDGKQLEYFRHQKSLTWINERAVEIPIIVDSINTYHGKRILEVGAVLPHYYPNIKKDVVDKFEKGDNIINEDIITFKPKEKYGLIVSISTLEHVGFDDDLKDDQGLIKALDNLEINCLAPGGKIVITLPIGYNPSVDLILFSNRLKFDEERFFKKVGFLNIWEEITKEQAKKEKFDGFHADCIFIGVIADEN
jgi:hypothetical protein